MNDNNNENNTTEHKFTLLKENENSQINELDFINLYAINFTKNYTK